MCQYALNFWAVTVALAPTILALVAILLCAGLASRGRR